MSQKEFEVKLVRPHLRFIFLHHGHFPESPQPLLAALADRNILFIETIIDEPDIHKRQRIEAALNLVLASPDRLDEKANQNRSLLLTECLESQNFVNHLAGLLAGTNKRLFLVDIDPSHDCYPLLEAGDRHREAIFDRLRLGQFAEAINSHHLYVDTRADLHEQREDVVHMQVKDHLAILCQSNKPVNAAIIQGVIHSPTATLFEGDEADAETLVFEKILSLEAELWLAKRLGQEINESDYLLALLADFILPFAYSSPLDFDSDEYSDITALADKLTPSQVEEAFRSLEFSYHQNLTHFTKRRRPTDSDKQIYGIYAFRQAVSSLLADLKRWTGN